MIMKKFLRIATLAFSIPLLAQTPCENGFADGFPCDNYDLMAQLSRSDMDADFVNDSWGWTDPQDGKEYAIIGLNNGTAFIDVTDPVNVVYLGKLPTHNGVLDGGQIWRDVKVYENHAFIVSEIFGHGMQVFDLTRLRNVTNAPETFTEDAHYDGFGRAHNIVINEDSGFAYGVGTTTFDGGAHMVNIQDPTNPVFAGGYDADFYTHDAQVVNYIGDDPDHQNKEIYFGSNEDQLVIVDVTDKSNPTNISSQSYSDVSYTHQSWLTEDQKYVLICDEIDEIDSGFNSRTVVFDVTDLDAPTVLFQYFGETEATDHNGYIVGDKYYLASYRAGLRVIDIADIANGSMEEIGFFDTVPDSNSAGTGGGTWSVYPFFESGNIVMSGGAGFTLVRDSNLLSVSETSNVNFRIFPNPANNQLTVHSKNTPITQIEIFNVLGQAVLSLEFTASISKQLDISSLNAGMYLMRINNTTTKRLVVE